MAKKPAAEVEPIRTLDELAKIVGRNKGTVSRWLKRTDWTFGRWPWPRRLVPDILRWAAAHLRDRSDVAPAGEAAAEEGGGQAGGDGGDGSPAGARPAAGTIYELKQRKLAAEVRKLEAQADQAQTSMAKERGDLLDADDVEMRWARVGATIRSGFENLASEVVGHALTRGMPQASAVAFHRQVDAAVDRVLQKLSEDDDGDAEDDEDGEA